MLEIFVTNFLKIEWLNHQKDDTKLVEIGKTSRVVPFLLLKKVWFFKVLDINSYFLNYIFKNRSLCATTKMGIIGHF